MSNDKYGEIETWAVVEIFGHKKLAGFARSVPMGGAMMLRVDVPEQPAESHSPAVPAFTQFLGIASIFSLTPCSEEAARAMLKSWRVSPPTILSLPPPVHHSDSDDDQETFDDEPF